jgi:hypothetical protein
MAAAARLIPAAPAPAASEPLRKSRLFMGGARLHLPKKDRGNPDSSGIRRYGGCWKGHKTRRRGCRDPV